MKSKHLCNQPEGEINPKVKEIKEQGIKTKAKRLKLETHPTTIYKKHATNQICVIKTSV